MSALNLYCQMNDDERAEQALNIINKDDPTDQDIEFIHHVWTGNYLKKGNPFFHHPALSIYSWAVLAFISENNLKFMSDDDLDAFNQLPEKVTVYRGGSACGFSWSLSYEVAKSFGEVFTATVNKGDILAYINDREEFEIIPAYSIEGVTA
ncbi:MAG: hypothetical protein ACK5NC_05340 [Vibrio sp.]